MSHGDFSTKRQGEVWPLFHSMSNQEKTMRVFVNGKPIITETNLAWALPYWKAAKRKNPRITWTFIN